jgi:hypothetical protein
VTLTADQLHRLFFESLTDKRTITRCYAGESVRPLARQRIERAARALGIDAPPAVSGPSK